MTYAVELPAAGPDDWSAWTGDLVARIRALGPGEDVLITVPSITRPHLIRQSRIFGLIPASHDDTSPWARVRRDEDHAVAEIIGSENFGGDYLLSKEDEDLVDSFGWHRPGSDLIETRIWSRWFPDDVAESAYLPLADARAAAELVARTLREVFLSS